MKPHPQVPQEQEEFQLELSMAALAAAMSDASRMKILCALMDGRAWTATELSAVSDIAPSTTSAHLSRLLKANLVTCLSQGRHRYFRLYSASIAALLENMMGVSFGAMQPPKTRVPAELQRARTCYDHLAGEIAVGIYDYLFANAWITSDGNALTPLGKAQFSQLGVMLDAKTKRKKCCACLDWSERKFHLGGHAGAALFQCFEQQGWIEKVPGYREVTVTAKGQAAFSQYFGLANVLN
ncbi:ArsR/SmtB family transcription factor [Photobacterium arenosum]|uniref:ArsR/SmtB family transcription factor n=1 Tax=Photobacterium arenosum TaxID=2774143 RepID=UPI0040584C94